MKRAAGLFQILDALAISFLAGLFGKHFLERASSRKHDLPGEQLPANAEQLVGVFSFEHADGRSTGGLVLQQTLDAEVARRHRRMSRFKRAQTAALDAATGGEDIGQIGKLLHALAVQVGGFCAQFAHSVGENAVVLRRG